MRVDRFNGVFIFPKPMLKITGGATTGGVDDLAELEANDLTLVFAHEANEFDATPEGLEPFAINHFRRPFQSDDAGVVSMIADDMADPPTDGTGDELKELLDATSTARAENDFLREVWLWEDGEPEPTSVNKDALEAIAIKIAQLRTSAKKVTSGVIKLRGLHMIQPGEAGGAVTAVTWNLQRRETRLSINQHEEPFGYFERLERAAGRSVAAGLSRFTLPGSSAALSDSREGGAPASTASADAGTPTAANRGREETAEKRIAETPNARTNYETIVGRLGRITGETSLGPNRWEYTVTLGHIADDFSFTLGSTTITAINQRELGNAASGVQDNGVNVDTLDAGLSLQPVRGVVEIIGECGPAGMRRGVFNEFNGVDGACT